MASAARTVSRAFARSTPATSSFRPVVRNARFALPAQGFRASGRRGYASEAGAGKSSSSGLLWAGVALAGGAGAWYYLQGSDVAAKVKGPFVPTKEDYQKVYNEIAKLLVEKDDYDDGSYGPVRCDYPGYCCQDAATDSRAVCRSSFVLPGTPAVPMTRRLAPVAATVPP